ncbi:MAG: redoxin domain-containing protein [Armatimonadota bacterium]
MKATGIFAMVMAGVIVLGSVVLAAYRPAQPPGVVTNGINLAVEPRHPVTLKMEQDAKAVTGEPAPEIDLPDQDGHPIKLSELVKQGPVVVVTMKDGCPCTIESQPFFNALAESYKGKVQFLGVTDGTKYKASKYKDDFSVPFPIVTETGMHTFEAFQSPRSVYYTLIKKGGVVRKLWPGYSKKTLDEFNSALAEEAGTPKAKLDTEMAPDKESSGCKFGEPVAAS